MDTLDTNHEEPRSYSTANDDGDIAFDELVQTESLIKERTLKRISNANRERSLSNLGQSVHSQESDRESGGEKEDEEFIRLTDMRKSLFEAIPEPYYESKEFRRVVITTLKEGMGDHDSKEACKLLQKCMKIREKWVTAHPFPPQDISENCFESYDGKLVKGIAMMQSVDDEFRRRSVPPYEIFEQPLPDALRDLEYRMVRGVMIVRRIDPSTSVRRGSLKKGGNDYFLSSSDDGEVPKSLPGTPSTRAVKTLANAGTDWSETIFPVGTFEEFLKDFQLVRKTVFSGPVASYAFNRLEFLFAKFNLHCLLNASLEMEAQKCVPHRDFYNVRKVDTHVHHSACMNQKHLLRFIKHKLKHHPTEAVIFRDGRFLTLGEVFKSLNLTAYDLSIDTLDMHANNTFHRFDKFNLKYNPAGQSRLREIFLKTDNVIGGRYLAEITQEVMQDLSASKYQLVEWRISIYGRKASEWSSLARWFYIHRLAHPNVRWLIQIPRLYDIYRKSGEVHNFGQMLSNIFAPLFAVSIDPSSNPPLHYLLQTVVGIDSVDDESRPEFDQLNQNTPIPELWDMPYNPPYGYWMYYMYANICVLNKLRASRGLSTFQFRPHCGEAGDLDHLISTYLVAHQINHGILLRKNPALQYLYYLSQIGIAMSPLSNNKLFLNYNKNPFIKYFQLGMNVSLSTDDPLMLHMTKDPLVEEYSVAAQVWKLTACDQCEIARNSVLQSGWERKFKLHFLGKDYCDIRETNVPMIRLLYREETLADEIREIENHATS